jgi:hypothetical protein
MRRIEPAYPDLLPVTHVIRPGYVPGPRVLLDPIRMGVVWSDAPRRVLPTRSAVPRQPVRAIVFASVARHRQDTVERLLERGSSLLVVLDDPEVGPADLGLDTEPEGVCVRVIVPLLPPPLTRTTTLPERWSVYPWGAILGLFPFPDAASELEHSIVRLKQGGASFAISAPLLLTPKDRHRILDECDDGDEVDRLENCLFHADVGRGLHALERRAGISITEADMDPVLCTMAPRGQDANAARTAALLRLWARRLDQSYEESSRGWRLRRAAAGLERLGHDPETLAAEDNLRVIPGFDPWVESFVQSLWYGGEPLTAEWRRWSSQDGRYTS